MNPQVHSFQVMYFTLMWHTVDLLSPHKDPGNGLARHWLEFEDLQRNLLEGSDF